MNMILKFRILTISVLMFPLLMWGQTNQREFIKSNVFKDKIEIIVSDGLYKIVPFSKQIVHTTFYPKDEAVKNFSYAVANGPEEIAFIINDKENELEVIVNELIVRVSKSPFNISYFYKNDLLIGENKGFVATDTSRILNFKIEPKEVLYGGGERVLGMDRRGNRLQLYNRAHYGYGTHSELMNYTLPVFLSSKKYAVLFDNASAGFLDLDSRKDNSINYETVSGTMNYYIVAGNNWYDLIDQYTKLTGYQPLPPRWAFGNFSSRFGYHSQAETESTVEKYFTDSIPLDAVIIDIYWFGKEIKGEMGNLDWLRDSFPNPERMIDNFKQKGVNTILVTEPFILTTSKRWTEAVDKKVLCTDSVGKPYTFDFYFGNTGLVDVFDTTARTWFWNIYKTLTKQGVAGWWGDLGEPEVHPADIRHKSGTGDEVHNAYGHEWAKLIYDGYRKDFPDTRPFILMRAGYAGSQRYGMIPWTGDVSRSWDGLVSQPEISLQMGMQGLAYTHSDLGGFAGGDSLDNELYVRWLQYGIFQPVYRPHAQEQIPAEPVFQTNNTKALVKEAIDLRYRLKPYIYNMAFENSISGKPLMIPLFFNEPDNEKLLTYDSAYMWGDAFLVSPVKQRGKKVQQIYFPQGTNWTDFYTGENYPGGKEYTVSLSLGHIPVFVKGGTFIPMTRKAVNEVNYSLNEFEMHYFVDNQVNKSFYHLYNDDGKEPDAYKTGDYEMLTFWAEKNKKALTFTIQKIGASEAFEAVENRIELMVHNLTNVPKKVSVNGIKLKSSVWNWDKAKRILVVKVVCSVEKNVVEIR